MRSARTTGSRALTACGTAVRSDGPSATARRARPRLFALAMERHVRRLRIIPPVCHGIRCRCPRQASVREVASRKLRLSGGFAEAVGKYRRAAVGKTPTPPDRATRL